MLSMHGTPCHIGVFILLRLNHQFTESYMKKLLTILILSALFSISTVASSNWNVAQLTDHLGYHNYSEVQELTEDENWAIMAYGFTDETDYQDMNGYLRYGSDYDLYNQTEASVTKLINDVISAATKLPRIPKGLVVYRGFKLSWREDRCFSKGEVIPDKAFTSSTLNKRIAKHFAFKKGSGKGAFLTIELSSNQKGILITENDESEVLLMPGRKMTITDGHESNGKCFATATLN